MISNLTYITQWPTKVDLNGSKKRIRWQNELQLALFEYVFQTFKDLWGGISETVCFETCFIIHPPCVEAFLVGGGLWNRSQSNLFQNSPSNRLEGGFWNRSLTIAVLVCPRQQKKVSKENIARIKNWWVKFGKSKIHVFFETSTTIVSHYLDNPKCM